MIVLRALKSSLAAAMTVRTIARLRGQAQVVCVTWVFEFLMLCQ